MTPTAALRGLLQEREGVDCERAPAAGDRP